MLFGVQLVHVGSKIQTQVFGLAFLLSVQMSHTVDSRYICPKRRRLLVVCSSLCD